MRSTFTAPRTRTSWCAGSRISILGRDTVYTAMGRLKRVCWVIANVVELILQEPPLIDAAVPEDRDSRVPQKRPPGIRRSNRQ